MDTVQVQAKLTFEQLVEAVKQLPRNKQKELARRIGEWQSNIVTAHKTPSNDRLSSHKKPVLDQTKARIATLAAQTDAALLAMIEKNSKLPNAEQRRYNRLRRKSESDAMTDAEWSELQKLTQRREQMTVAWLEALIALAQKRGTDLDTLMRELGLEKKRDVS